MKYEVQEQKSGMEISVEVPFEEFEPHVKRAAALISKKREFKGFRRGKAPYDVVKNVLGEQAIYEEAADMAVRATYPKLLEQLKAEERITDAQPPVGRPEINITKLAPGNELTFRVVLALLPDVALPDYKNIAQSVRKKEMKDIEVTEDEITKAIDWLRESRVQLVTVSRGAKKGDRVEVNFEMRRDGVKIDEGESRNHPLVLGEKTFLPGFEEEIMGMQTNEKREFSLVIPKDWAHKAIAGAEIQFSVTMQLVQERTMPELNDEFAKSAGNFLSVEELKKNIKEGIEQEKRDKETQRVRSMMIDAVAKKSTVEISEVLISHELTKMFDEFRSGITQMGMKWEDYLTHLKKTEEDLQKEWRPEAERRVRSALVLREIAHKEEIEPTDEEISARMEELLARHGMSDEQKQNIDKERINEYTKDILKNEKVFSLFENV